MWFYWSGQLGVLAYGLLGTVRSQHCHRDVGLPCAQTPLVDVLPVCISLGQSLMFVALSLSLLKAVFKRVALEE
ncbi:hypothetical protein BaRGS_00001710, partial [Batillaria attramentaria]